MNSKSECCWSSPYEILKLLDERATAEDLRTVERFVRRRPDTLNDFATSLVIFRCSAKKKLGANIHVSSDIDKLPLIVREGDQPPFVYGRQIGLGEEVITDPLIQRIGSLFLTRDAAAQELLEILCTVLGIVKCDFRLEVASDDKPVEQWTSEFQREFESKKKECAVLIVRATNNSEEWTIAGFSDTGEFCTVLINDSGHELPKELKKEPRDNKRIIDLATSSLDRTHFQWNLNSEEKENFLNEINRTYDSLGSAFLDLNDENHFDSPIQILERAGILSNQEKHKFTRFIPEDKDEKLKKYKPLLERMFDSDSPSHDRNPKHDYHLGRDRLSEIKKISTQATEPSPRIIVQGMGNLSFNNGCVAYYLDECEGQEREHTVIPHGEPYDHRSYCCLVKWKDIHSKGDEKHVKDFEDVLEKIRTHRLGVTVGHDLAIIRTRLFPTQPYIQLEDGSELRGYVQFAVSGRQIVAEGKVIPRGKLATEFSDRRHVFCLPNIGRFKDGEQDGHLFGRKKQEADMWLLEPILLRHPNLCKIACYEPITVPLAELGCSRERATAKLKETGYTETIPKMLEPTKRGEFAWRGKAHPVLRIYLKENVYPCTIVGLGNPNPDSDAKDCNFLYLLAWGHDYKKGYTIWEAAKVIRAAGARYALVIDEGQDVFQVHIPPRELGSFIRAEDKLEPLDPWMPVPFAYDNTTGNLKRRSLRASIAFWQKCRDE